MNSDQWRVLGILGAVLGVEVLFSPDAKAAVVGLGKGQYKPTSGSSTGAGALPGPLAGLFGYAVAGLALVALADVAPNLATWLAALALVYALLSHGDSVTGFITTVRGGVQTLAGRQPSNS